MKVIITGATGTAGAEAVRQALFSPAIEQVPVLARRPLPPYIVSTPPPPKFNFIQHADFASYPPPLLAQLRDHDACIWDLGVSAVGITEQKYELINKDYPVAATKAFATLSRAGGPGKEKFVFCYCSGQGVPQDAKAAGRLPMFGRLFPVMRFFAPSTVIEADDLAKGMLRAALVGGASGGVPGWEGKGELDDKGAFTNDECKRLASEFDAA